MSSGILESWIDVAAAAWNVRIINPDPISSNQRQRHLRHGQQGYARDDVPCFGSRERPPTAAPARKFKPWTGIL